MRELCACPVDGNSRLVNLEIGDRARIISLRCPSCELDVLTARQELDLHAEDLTVTMTTIREALDGEEEGEEYVWYSLSAPPAEALEAERVADIIDSLQTLPVPDAQPDPALIDEFRKAMAP